MARDQSVINLDVNIEVRFELEQNKFTIMILKH